MQASHLHYLPIAYPYFSILVGIFIALVVLVQVRALRYAYMRLGLSSGAAFLLLVGPLVGSYFNIPIAELPEQQRLSSEEIDFFGIRYMVPAVVDWPGTVIAINVGGALIPGLTSVYLLARHNLWLLGSATVACVAAICYWLARPVPGLGIALPVFVPAIATAIVALVISRRHAAPLAYIGGCLGTLMGGDLLNLNRVQNLGAPIVSIGGGSENAR
jgi:uncharacterized membrane protein